MLRILTTCLLFVPLLCSAANIRIDQLPEVTSLNTNDLFLVNADGTNTSKITVTNVIKSIAPNFATTNNINTSINTLSNNIFSSVVTNTQINVTLNGNPSPINNISSGANSWTEGNTVTASGDNSHAEGYQNLVDHFAAHVEGGANEVEANYGHGEGYYNIMTGSATNSHVEGYYNTISGPNAHIEGSGNYANGNSAHSEGYNNNVGGDYSHAEGQGNWVSGNNSHAAGHNMTALSDYSYIWGADPDDVRKTNSTPFSFEVYAPGGINLSGAPISGDGSNLTNLPNIITGRLISAPNSGNIKSVYINDNDATGNLRGSGVTARYFLNYNNNSRIGQSGVVSNITFRLGIKPAQLQTFTISIWRGASNSLTRIYSQDFLPSIPSSGLYSLVPSSTWNVQMGDYIGHGFTASSAPGLFLGVAVENTTASTFYVDSEPTPINYNWTTNSSSANIYPININLTTSPDWIFSGDSIIAGHPANYSFTEDSNVRNNTNQIGYWVTSTLGGTYQNVGIGDQICTNILMRATNDVILKMPKVAVWDGGLNDISLGTGSVNGYIYCISNWITACQASNIWPVIYSIPPWTAGTSDQMTSVDAYNAAGKPVVQALGGTWIEIKNYVGVYRSSGPLGNKWDISPSLTPDNVHYTAAGYKIWANALIAALPTSILAKTTTTDIGVYPGANSVQIIGNGTTFYTNGLVNIPGNVTALSISTSSGYTSTCSNSVPAIIQSTTGWTNTWPMVACVYINGASGFTITKNTITITNLTMIKLQTGERMTTGGTIYQLYAEPF